MSDLAVADARGDDLAVADLRMSDLAGADARGDDLAVADLRIIDLAVVCAPGTADCNLDPTDGCETRIDVDSNNCGGCGKACGLANAVPACAMGACTVASCIAGYADCNQVAVDGCERRLENDLANCGACGMGCPAGPHVVATCTKSVCGLGGCAKDFADCNKDGADGCEANLQADAKNCGACGTVCPGQQLCVHGVCASCGPGALGFLVSVMPGLDAAFTPVAIAIGDLNGDGRADVVVADSANLLNGYPSGVWVFLANANGTLQPGTNYATGVGNASSVALGDLNGDGKLDLAVTNTSSFFVGNLSVLLGKGDGTFAAAVSYAVDTDPLVVAIGDLNGDGKADLAVGCSGFPGKLDTLLGNGDGTFQKAVISQLVSSPTSVAMRDLDGDGKADVVATVRDEIVSVLLGKGDGTFQVPQDYQVGRYVASVVIAELNGDARPDLVVSSQGDGMKNVGAVGVLLGNGNGTFKPVVNYLAGAGPSSVAVSDLNRDGIADLAVANSGSGSLSVLLGNGNGSFQPVVNFGFERGGNTVVAIGDLDGDGKKDLVAANLPDPYNPPGNISVALGNGDGSFRAQRTVGIGPGPLAAADFNGDGKTDFVAATSGDNSNHLGSGAIMYLGHGDGTFQVTQGFYGPITATAVASGDLDGNGIADLIITYQGSAARMLPGENQILMGIGGGDLKPGGGWHYAALEDSSAVAIGDLKGDGTRGFVIGGCRFQNDPNNPKGLVSDNLGWSDFVGSGCPSAVAIGELSGDGKPDLVVASQTGLFVLLGNGDGSFQKAVDVGGGAQTSRVAIADLNGDGKADLVGDHGVLLGNGNGTFRAPLPVKGVGVLGDLNGDGKVDLVSGTSVLVGNGDGTFQDPIEFGGGGWQSIITDVNGDCRPDIISVGQDGATIMLNTTH